MAYRQSRNFEASIINYIQDQLETSWSGVRVEGTFANVYEGSMPVVCVIAGRTQHPRVEIGSSSTRRDVQMFIHIFATNDGQRLDLKDFLISVLKGGCTYYEYIVSNGQVQNKTANGNIIVTSINDDPIDLLINKSSLDDKDRYRHLIQINVRTGKVEI